MFDESDIIHRYSRADALRDGVLIDVTTTAKEAGFRYLTAVTSAVWARYVEVPEEVQAQDVRGRLWDILWMLRYAISQAADASSVLFHLHVRNSNDKPELVTLKAICDPDDDGSPCITVLMPNED